MVADEDGVAISDELKIDVDAATVAAAEVAVVVAVVDVVEGVGTRSDATRPRYGTLITQYSQHHVGAICPEASAVPASFCLPLEQLYKYQWSSACMVHCRQA